jgi:hypothetical protein
LLDNAEEAYEAHLPYCEGRDKVEVIKKTTSIKNPLASARSKSGQAEGLPSPDPEDSLKRVEDSIKKVNEYEF